MSAYTDRPDEWHERIDDGSFRTLVPLVWHIGRPDGPAIVIPAGFTFDVSVPRWLWWAISPTEPRYLGAAAIHDWMLLAGDDVWTAGAQFRAALEADGVRPPRRLLMTLAVIAFAG